MCWWMGRCGPSATWWRAGSRSRSTTPNSTGRHRLRTTRPRTTWPTRTSTCIVVDKPAGVVVHPARGHWAGTLAQALAGRAAGGEESWRAGIVHRLDRDTSGLLVVAKSDEVHRALKALLSARRLRREYLALVDGHPPARTGTIDAPIGRHRRDRKLMSIDSDDPREARTHFEIERLLPATRAAARHARDGPHPPDPRPPGRHRPSRLRRHPVRHERTLRPDPPVSARRAPGVRAPGDARGGRRALGVAGGAGGGAGVRRAR